MEPIIGQRVGGDPADESAHFYRCEACRQMVDMRDLAAVMQLVGHAPLPREDAERVLNASRLLKRALSK